MFSGRAASPMLRSISFMEPFPIKVRTRCSSCSGSPKWRSAKFTATARSPRVLNSVPSRSNTMRVFFWSIARPNVEIYRKNSISTKKR